MSEKLFTVSVEHNGELERILFDESEYVYAFELDDVIGVFHVIAHVLYENGFTFTMSVNKVIVPTLRAELSIFLESLLELVVFANSKEVHSYDFDFYEQGINYSFTFKRVDDHFYMLEFVDKSGAFERMELKGALLELRIMLYTFYARITFLSAVIAPVAGNCQFFIEWRDRVAKAFSASTVPM